MKCQQLSFRNLNMLPNNGYRRHPFVYHDMMIVRGDVYNTMHTGLWEAHAVITEINDYDVKTEVYPTKEINAMYKRNKCNDRIHFSINGLCSHIGIRPKHNSKNAD